ncbi:hypothetical protein EWM64_g5301 [Hericium alpestre]|uniref:NAD(P)-binding protein n=1 Tax=Hericium alpestre TaxID=135208 RepID=A0A4Y9ZXR8_9AGAM|nr:hypothetical protein EWM64_g5301 [Hericium alpestre]
MVRVRDTLEKEWDGLDTLIVCAGVSALQPLMTLTDSENANPPSAQGVQRAADIALAAIQGNYTGPLISAVTMIPTLERSPSPSILLVSSIGAIIPAPTRTLYGSSKSASLLLYQALSIEHPRIVFTYLLPSTVQGSFRASAVDGGPVRESDPNLHGLRKEDVARRAVRALDAGEGAVFYPGWYRWVHLLYWAWPGLIEWGARRKYKFK